MAIYGSSVAPSFIENERFGRVHRRRCLLGFSLALLFAGGGRGRAGGIGS